VWFGLAVFVASFGRPSSTNAMVLAAIWLAFVVLVPSLLNMGATTWYPVPSRVQMVQAVRASDEANQRLLSVPKVSASFHGFEEYERLVDAAKSEDAEAHLIVLLGGEAGLRCGEILALEWRDVDLEKRQLSVQRSSWNGQTTAPKSGRVRYIPLTRRLAEALRQHRHLRSRHVLCQRDGAPLSRQQVQYRVKRAARQAEVRDRVHLLRHTFCSHLAMRGAPGRAIQELAGHSELGVTQRYMHLSPAALDAAVQLLDGRGNRVATAIENAGIEQKA
jgi:integrase